MLMVAVPIGLFVGLLALANKRAEAKLREEAEAEPVGDGEPGPT